MPNSRYDKFKSKQLDGEVSWKNDNIKIAILGDSYAGGFVSLEEHEFFSDISSSILTGTKPIVRLENKFAITNGKHGYASADDILFEEISAGQVITYFIIFKDSDSSNLEGHPTNPSESPLILMIDSGYGIGSGTNGGGIVVRWNTQNGIFRI